MAPGALGSTFLNVFAGDGSLTDDERLRSALEALATRPRPCTLWVSRSASLVDSHELPPFSTLAFAPGAVLTLMGTLTVLGRLDAGVGPRFRLRGGDVLLRGPLEEIVADWWRVSGGPNPVELAVAVCWDRALQPDLSPCPVRLTGPYELIRTLRLAPPPALTGRVDITLRGQHTRRSDPATFVVPDRADAPSTLMSVEGGVVLDMEHVAFDAGRNAARPPAETCLSLEGRFHRSRIEACFFTFATWGIRVRTPDPDDGEVLQPLVTLPFGTGGTPQAPAFPIEETDTNRLAISRCLFVGGAAGTNIPIAGCAVDVGFAAPTMLSLRDCQFVGAYYQGITVLGGELDVTACQFANDTEVIVPPDRNSATTDILVRRGMDLAVHLPFEPVPKGRPYQGPRGSRSFVSERPVADTHLTVLHCVSTSPTFLVLHPSFDDPDALPGGATLTNVRHTARGPEPTSVYVGEHAGSRSLMLQGCWFSGSVAVAPNAIRDVVVDLGCRFEAGARIIDAEPGVGTPQEVITLREPLR